MATDASAINTLEALKVIPTGAALGAEVRGIDLAQEMPEEVESALHQSWTEHLVLLLRNQCLSPPQLIEASKRFGGVQVGGAHAFFMRAGMSAQSADLAAYPEITPVTNLSRTGELGTWQHGGGLAQRQLLRRAPSCRQHALRPRSPDQWWRRHVFLQSIYGL